MNHLVPSGSALRRKLHIGVDREGLIHAQELTVSTVDDASTGVEILSGIRSKLSSVAGHGAYDSMAIYDAARSHGAKVIVPPSRSATVSRRAPSG